MVWVLFMVTSVGTRDDLFLLWIMVRFQKGCVLILVVGLGLELRDLMNLSSILNFLAGSLSLLSCFCFWM